MGNISSREALALRWAELCNDPLPRDLPGKIELNGHGVIEMSPASHRHGMKHASMARTVNLRRAVEVWIVGQESGWQVFDAAGARPASGYGVQLEPEPG